MAILEVVSYPHPALKKVTKAVTQFDSSLKTLIDSLFETMYAEDGGGLAANQVNINQRIFVMDMSDRRNEPLYFINPELVVMEGEETAEEGCLSFPSIVLKITRPKYITIKAQDLQGNYFTLSKESYDARCLHHETDHLNGITFFDYLSPLKRQLSEKKLNKYVRMTL